MLEWRWVSNRFKDCQMKAFQLFIIYLNKQTRKCREHPKGLLCKSFCLENCKRYLKKRKLIAFRLSVCVHVTRSNLIFGLINLSFMQVLVFFASYRTTNSSCVTLDNFSTPKNTTHALAKNNKTTIFVSCLGLMSTKVLRTRFFCWIVVSKDQL